jgi:hypothetical protein
MKLGIFYWKSKKGQEVDFIVRKGSKISAAIQVTHSLSNVKVNEREIQSLLQAKKELNPEHLIILTEDEEGLEKAGDAEIKVLPLWK